MSSQLDDEIENLQARVASLKKQLRLQTSTLIASPSTRQLLSSSSSSKDSSSNSSKKLLDQLDAQRAHDQESLYRACAGVTTFLVQDPDPNAVDGGAVLGLRFEIVSRAKFLRPCFVFLNRRWADKKSRRGYLAVHRHTFPACIPVSSLAARYLPPPPSREAGSDGARSSSPPKQDLARFARMLRRELVRYHHRRGVVADLRKAAGLGRKRRAEDEGSDESVKLADITQADAEAKQISLEWADGRTGRLVMGDDGEIVKVIALGDNGRDRAAVRELVADSRRVDDVVRRLASA